MATERVLVLDLLVGNNNPFTRVITPTCVVDIDPKRIVPLTVHKVEDYETGVRKFALTEVERISRKGGYAHLVSTGFGS